MILFLTFMLINFLVKTLQSTKPSILDLLLLRRFAMKIWKNHHPKVGYFSKIEQIFFTTLVAQTWLIDQLYMKLGSLPLFCMFTIRPFVFIVHVIQVVTCIYQLTLTKWMCLSFATDTQNPSKFNSLHSCCVTQDKFFQVGKYFFSWANFFV